MMSKLTADAKRIRDEMVEDAVERYGVETVERWADDPVLSSALNAMAQMYADDEAGR